MPEKLRNTVYWNVMPDNDYATQDGRLVFGLSSADAWADVSGELAQLEFDVVDANRLEEVELKLVEVEVTPDGYDPIVVPGSKMAVDNGDEDTIGSGLWFKESTVSIQGRVEREQWTTCLQGWAWMEQKIRSWCWWKG